MKRTLLTESSSIPHINPKNRKFPSTTGVTLLEKNPRTNPNSISKIMNTPKPSSIKTRGIFKCGDSGKNLSREELAYAGNGKNSLKYANANSNNNIRTDATGINSLPNNLLTERLLEFTNTL